VKVVLTCVCDFLYITRSVSLVVRFLRNAMECHYAHVWYHWLVIVWRFSTYCVFITFSAACLCHKGKIITNILVLEYVCTLVPVPAGWPMSCEEV